MIPSYDPEEKITLYEIRQVLSQDEVDEFMFYSELAYLSPDKKARIDELLDKVRKAR